MAAQRVRGKSSGLKMVPKRKKHLGGLIEAWLKRCGLDYYVDLDQMWEDMIVIRPYGTDSVPLILISMASGWELFAPIALSPWFSTRELDQLYKELNE